MSVSLDRRSRGRGRLLAQGLITRPFATPGDAVRAFGAMQGQELPGALASAALRTQEGSIGAVIADLDAGRIVRGYPMRGTLFLMAAEDLLWVSALCNPGTLKAARKRRGQLGLTDAHVERAREVAQVVLPVHASGLPRAELFAHWERAGTPTAAGCGYHSSRTSSARATSASARGTARTRTSSPPRSGFRPAPAWTSVSTAILSPRPPNCCGDT